ncbi:hypothetical protein ACO0OL_001029 [Hanseniaspora opuntiae]
MSFSFDQEVFLNGEIENLLKNKLNASLNTTTTTENHSKGKVKASNNNVFVKKISFNNKPPNIDILGISLSDHSSNINNETKYITNSRDNISNNNKTIKTIIKLLIENFSLELTSNIESNLLLVYGYTNIDPFILPDFVCNESFNIPINLKFENCKLESIFDMNYQINSMLKLDFKDVDISFEFDCSIPLLSDNIKKRLIDNVDFIFKDVIPNAVMDMSIKYMTKRNQQKATSSSHDSTNNLLFDEADEQFASNLTINKLNHIAQKRFTMSLRNLEEEDFTIERSNLNKILSRKVLRLNKLVKQNNHFDSNEPFKRNNVLPLNKNTPLPDDLIRNVARLQESLNDLTLKRFGKVKQYKRRKINLKKEKANEELEMPEKQLELPKHNKEEVFEYTKVEKSPTESNVKIEHPSFTRPFMNHNNSSLMLPPSPINVSFKKNKGFMMNRVLTPLLKEQAQLNAKKNQPLDDYDSSIKLNWSDNDNNESKKLSETSNNKKELSFENTPYLKLLERTPFKKWFNKEQDYNFNTIAEDYKKNYNFPPPPYTH